MCKLSINIRWSRRLCGVNEFSAVAGVPKSLYAYITNNINPLMQTFWSQPTLRYQISKIPRLNNTFKNHYYTRQANPISQFPNQHYCLARKIRISDS